MFSYQNNSIFSVLLLVIFTVLSGIDFMFRLINTLQGGIEI